jgi:hypothetical protein
MPQLNKSQREILAFIFDAQPHELTGSLSGWAADSARYAEFLATYRDKIRKKLRVTKDHEAIEDLGLELQVPRWFLRDRRFTLVYEPYAAGKTRGADYAINFRTNFTFNLESTNVRGLNAAAKPGEIDQRLIEVTTSKLGQMQPRMANVLLIQASLPLQSGSLDRHLSWLTGRAAANDTTFFARHQVAKPGEFTKQLKRLTSVIAYSAGQERQLWFNPQPAVSLPPDLKIFLQRDLIP